MGAGQADFLESAANQMRRFLNHPVMRFKGHIYGGLIYAPTKQLKLLVQLIGHGARNTDPSTGEQYFCYDVSKFNEEYRAYNCLERKIETIDLKGAVYSQGLALYVFPEKPGGIARTRFGPYLGNNEFNL